MDQCIDYVSYAQMKTLIGSEAPSQGNANHHSKQQPNQSDAFKLPARNQGNFLSSAPLIQYQP